MTLSTLSSLNFTINQLIDAQAGIIAFATQSSLPPVDVAPPGYAIRITWAGVQGATQAEVTTAAVHIAPALVEQVLGELPLSSSKDYRVVTTAGKRIKSLTLPALKAADGTLLKSAADLDSKGLRLAIALPAATGGFGSPLFAIPPLPARGLIPASLTGASFENGLLTLPNVVAAKLGLCLVSKDPPADFAPQPFSLEQVTGIAALSSKDLQVLDASGATIWAFPGEMPPQTAPVEVNLRFALEQALNAALTAGQPLDVTFLLTGTAPTRAGFRVSGVQGALRRSRPGVLRVALAGTPQPLDLGEPALAEELPGSAIADVTIRYEGIRLLEGFIDPVPAAGGASGQIVGDRPVVRIFPPMALTGLSLARVALIGRAPEDSELAVQWVDLSTGSPGAGISTPTVVKVKASTAIAPLWVTLPDQPSFTTPVGLAVRANRGRFFWAGETAPLVRLAIYDPDPGNRPLRLRGLQVAAIPAAAVSLPAAALPVAAFGGTTPLLESDLFLTVDLSDLVLRYPR